VAASTASELAAGTVSWAMIGAEAHVRIVPASKRAYNFVIDFLPLLKPL
jgi:hypothetical protein